MPQFWQDKKVLITGADGFIGSHLTEYLQSKGAIVRALVLYNSFNNWGWLENVTDHTNIEVIAGDIRDAECCQNLTRSIDVVFHLASLISVPYSIQNPASFLDTNISGTFNMCNAAHKSNSKFIYISSSEVYGTAQYLPIDEKHPLQAQSPYSASKISAEAIVYSFYRSYGLKAVIVRPFNTYGPRQSARAIIPAIIIQIANGGKEVKLGNLSPRRDLNYVTDTCRGMVLIAQNDDLIGETVNIGSGTDHSMAEVFALICKKMNADVKLVTEQVRVRPANAEVEHLLCNNSKIVQFTGFSPAYSFEEGLEQTIKWLISEGNAANYKSKVYNV
jgi:NAD dependent epimerase/dehydratase